MKLIGESATRSEAHRACGKRNQNKQLVRSANSLLHPVSYKQPLPSFVGTLAKRSQGLRV